MGRRPRYDGTLRGCEYDAGDLNEDWRVKSYPRQKRNHLQNQIITLFSLLISNALMVM